MNKIKLLIASTLFCAVGYLGYISYDRITMSETEKFMLENIEALTNNESDITLVICRCHTDLNCYGGNAISFRPECSVPAIGSGGSGNCRSNDVVCKKLN